MFIFRQYALAIRTRRVLIMTLFDKVSKLSIKSLSETNSGKLITLISADIFAIEKGLAMIGFIVVGPLVNLLVFIYFLIYQDWKDALIFAGATLILFIVQHFAT